MRDHGRERHGDGGTDHHDDNDNDHRRADHDHDRVNGLAQTGTSSSVPLSALGVLMSTIGGAAVARFRARRDYRLPQ